VVVGNAGLLRLDAYSAEDAESLDELLQAAQRASRLTGRLLAMGRRNAAARAPLSVDAALGEMEPLLHALVRGGVDLALRPGAGAARVLADATEIEQVVLNLVSNARDAIGGAGRIEVETDEADAATAGAPEGATAARWVRLRVRDTGVGMDGATLARLFEPFFTTKQGSAGTGLGLYTTSVLVRQMGGAIRATSKPGQGSTFEVVLPRLEDEASNAAQAGG
jgi:signal transduction histidine kinase